MDATTTQPPQVHVGIDVSKRRLDAHAIPSGEAIAVDNTADGVARLIGTAHAPATM